MNSTDAHIPIGSIKIIYPNSKVKVEKLFDAKSISCIGEDPKSPHHKVFLSLKSGSVKCPYCGIIFRKHL